MCEGGVQERTFDHEVYKDKLFIDRQLAAWADREPPVDRIVNLEAAATILRFQTHSVSLSLY